MIIAKGLLLCYWNKNWSSQDISSLEESLIIASTVVVDSLGPSMEF